MKKVGFFYLFLLTNTTTIAESSGTVFRDVNSNGTKDNIATFNEVGLTGVTVKAYNATGAQVGGDKTKRNTRAYSFTAYTLPMGVEFTNLSTEDSFDFQGTGSGLNVQFVSAASIAINFGIKYPSPNCVKRTLIKNYYQIFH